MKLNVSYFDNKIELHNDYITVIEIENKKYFYRFINDFYEIENNGFSDNLNFFDGDDNEKSVNGKLKVYLNFFDLGFDSKKAQTDIAKYISNVIEDDDKVLLQNQYSKIIKIYKKLINDIELPIFIDEEISLDSLSKLLKVSVDKKDDLLDNLFLLIDIEKIFRTNNILIFVNLKQYLSRNELLELYKYAIYNQVQLMLVDSQCYGGTLEYEKKLIVDENLDEFMI